MFAIHVTMEKALEILKATMSQEPHSNLQEGILQF